MIINTVVDTGFGFGMSLFAVGTIIAAFLRHLGATNTVIGLAPAITMAAMALPQLPVTHWTRGLREKKKLFVAIHISAYAPWLVIAALTVLWASPHPQRMIVALLALMGLAYLMWGGGPPLWAQLLPRLFPDRARGMAVGVIVTAQGLAGVAGGLLAAWVLAHVAYPDNFALLFLIAGAVMIVFRSLHLLSHESLPDEPPEVTREGMWRIVARLWRSDRRLRRFVLARHIYEGGALVGNFFAVYALTRFHLPDQAAGKFTLASCIGLAIVGPWLGRLGDRRGYRRVMGYAIVIWCATTAMIALAPSLPIVYAAFVIGGVAAAADGVAYVNLLVEMSEEKTRGYYVALGSTVMAPLRLAAPFMWGRMSDQLAVGLHNPVLGLHSIFVWGIILQALGWLALVATMDDPRRPRQRILHWHRGMGLPRLY